MKAVIIIGISLLLLLFVIAPLIQYSLTSGQYFHEILLAKSMTGSPAIRQYGINEPVNNTDLQVTVTSAQDGENIYNSQKFFRISVQLRNLNPDKNIQVSGSDFFLIDAGGKIYYPYSIESRIMYNVNPLDTGVPDLLFIIPQNTPPGKKLRFTFPKTADTLSNPDMVEFLV